MLNRFAKAPEDALSYGKSGNNDLVVKALRPSRFELRAIQGAVQ